MELKEYYKIWRANLSVVIYTILVAVVAVYAWSVKASQTFSASLLFNISRTETQNNSDFRYDQFYRLQADEKFAETVVEWLKSPGVALEIQEKAGLKTEGKTIRSLAKTFRAEKISPETVSITYASSDEGEAKKIAEAAGTVVEERTKTLNEQARDPLWFKIIPADFVVRRNIQNMPLNFFVAFAAGIFAGTLLALGKHYITH